MTWTQFAALALAINIAPAIAALARFHSRRDRHQGTGQAAAKSGGLPHFHTTGDTRG